MRLLFTLVLALLVGTAAAQSPGQRTVGGRVTDISGQPLPGATVRVDGGAWAVTDAQGNYSLAEVPAGAVLHVEFIGYAPQQINSGTRAAVDVTLAEAARTIDDVVVVGYGTQRKETLTGAVASINAEDIMTTKTDNLIQNVQGKVAGLFIRQRTGEPGAFDSKISVRGFGNPIVVIDGVVRGRADGDGADRSGASELAQLNSEDIESFTILKDGAAAIYGMNSANGVIIVTTKRGSAGKAAVSYNGMFGMRMPTGMPNMVDAYTYRVMENEFQRNIGAAPKYDADIIEKYRRGEPGYTDHDWVDMYLKKVVPSTNHTVSVRGGSDKMGYYASLGYTKDNGLIKSDIGFYDRYSIASSFNAQLTDNLKFNFNLTGRVDSSQRESEPFIWTYKSLIVNDRGVGPYTMAGNGHLSYVGPEGKNPAALIDKDLEGYNRTENKTAFVTMDLTYSAPFLRGLSVQALGSFDYSQGNRSILSRKHQLYDYYTDTPAGSRGSVAYENRIDLSNKTYGKVQANYHKAIGDHTIDVLAVGEASQQRFDRLSGRRNYDNDFYTFDILDMASTAGATNGGWRRFRTAAAFLGRVNYDYAGKYLVELMGRYDGSFRYAPGHRWTLLPSASVGWRASEERFVKDNLGGWLNNLKLRASYGESGIDQGNLYQYMAAYTQSGNHGYIFDKDVTSGFFPAGVVANDMSWIKSRIINIGVDFTVLKKLDVTVEWYERRLTGILATRIDAAPNTFGASFPQLNLNSERNLGLELDVKYRGSVGKDFKYTVGGNVSYTRLENLHRERGKFNSQWNRWKQGSSTTAGQDMFNGNSNRFKGAGWIYEYDGRYTSLADYETAPLQNGGARGNSRMLPGMYRIVDTNGDGRITGDDEQLNTWGFGDLNPPLQFGFTLSGSYKSWDVSMLFQGAALYTMNHRNNDIWGYGRYPTLHRKFLDRWHTTDPKADPLDPNTAWTPGKFPAGRPYNYDNTTDANVVDVWKPNAAYLRLKNIEIGYSLPAAALKKIGLKGLRVYANGTNLLTFTRRELREYDPEQWENDWSAGTSYPIMKAVNLGVNINF